MTTAEFAALGAPKRPAPANPPTDTPKRATSDASPQKPAPVRFHSRPACADWPGVTRVTGLTEAQQAALGQWLERECGAKQYQS